jgi:hypothetical protein
VDRGALFERRALGAELGQLRAALLEQRRQLGRALGLLARRGQPARGSARELRAALVERAPVAADAADLGQEALDLGQERAALVLAHLGIALGLLALAAQLGRALLVARELGAQERQVAVDLAQAVLRVACALARPLGLGLGPALGLAGLDLERAHARGQLADHVVEARQVVGHALEAQLGLELALAVAADAGGLLEDAPALERVGRQHRVDLALLEHRVAAAAEARVVEHLAHVLQTHARAVDQVLALAALEHAARDRDLRPVAVERSRRCRGSASPRPRPAPAARRSP